MKAGRVPGAASAPSTPPRSRNFIARYVRGGGSRTDSNTGLPQSDLKPPESAAARLARRGAWVRADAPAHNQRSSLILLDPVRSLPEAAAPAWLLPEISYLVLADVSSRLHRSSLRVMLSRWPAARVPGGTREILGASLECLMQLAGRDPGVLELAARWSGRNEAIILLRLRMSPGEGVCSGAFPEPEPGLLDHCAAMAEACGGRFRLSANFSATTIRITLPIVRANRREASVKPSQARLDVAADGFLEKALLTTEVSVQSRFRDARRSGDGLRRGRMQARPGK